MSEPNKIIAAIQKACKYCWSQICNLQVSIYKDWQLIGAVTKRCWTKKTINSEHWKDLAQEEELRWQSARLVLKVYILVFVLGVIALIPKRLVSVVMPTRASLLDQDSGQQAYSQRSYEDDQPQPAVTYPYPDILRLPHRRAMSVPMTTTLPEANLPATPGINAPLPVPAVPRSGLPLMPLGDRH